jgi:hypothetical protein
MTTEFWLAFGVAASLVVGGVYSDQMWAQITGGLGAALATAGYGFARSSVKKAQAPFKGDE